MDIEQRIKELEVERDKILAETPLEIISSVSTGKGRTRQVTNHSVIKTNYNRKINYLKKYGVENIHNIPEIKEKIVSNQSKGYTKAVREKMSIKRKEQWNDPEYREKVTQSNKDTKSSLEYREKISKIAKLSHNTESYKNTYSKLMLKRWQNPDYRQKTIQSNIKTKNTLEYKEKFANIQKNKWMNSNMRDKIVSTNLEKYGVKWHCEHPNCYTAGGSRVSHVNVKFQENIKLLTGLEFELEKDGFDLVYNNIAIEIDPSYTHNSTKPSHFNKFNLNPKEPDYHLNKTLKANKLGYQCIHIFDWDDEYKIIEMFKPKETLYARNCRIKEVPQEECKEFLMKYHLQGTCNKQEIRLGLYKGNELIQLMTFGKPRYNKNYEYELLRLCTKAEYKVVGGAEKLFKYFKENYNPSSIISYCDNSKFNGDVYKRLGFNLKSLGQPSKHWYNIKTHRHITNNLLNQRGFSQLHGDKKYEKAEKGTSNEQLMLEAGYVEVYDCGQSTYIYENIE